MGNKSMRMGIGPKPEASPAAAPENMPTYAYRDGQVRQIEYERGETRGDNTTPVFCQHKA